MSKWITKDTLWSSLMTVAFIVCFPANPLVLTGVLEVKSYTPLFVIGWVVWAFGMVLVMAPIVLFPRRGGVPTGKSFVHTTRLVSTGIYAVVRHPQYTGGIYAIFITTLLWYPHWLFALLGVVGTAAIYLSIKGEDRHLVEKFSSDYQEYMSRVPGMNVFVGVSRLMRHRRKAGDDA